MRLPFLLVLAIAVAKLTIIQHFFLQHLPSIPQVRSLYIPHIADHPHGADSDPRELALQIVDIVTLRPDIELCYMGIAGKCFEILENQSLNHSGHRDHSADSIDPADGGGAGPTGIHGYQTASARRRFKKRLTRRCLAARRKKMGTMGESEARG